MTVRLVRDGDDVVAEFRADMLGGGEPDMVLPAAPGAIPDAERPVVRHVTFEVPDGFMATISLVPYTELPPEPDPA